LRLSTEAHAPFDIGQDRGRDVSGVTLLIGGMAVPGAFLAKAFVERMRVHIHTAILDAAVIVGGLVMISAAVRHLVA
jgi:hypothetical protein